MSYDRKRHGRLSSRDGGEMGDLIPLPSATDGGRSWTLLDLPDNGGTMGLADNDRFFGATGHWFESRDLTVRSFDLARGGAWT